MHTLIIAVRRIVCVVFEQAQVVWIGCRFTAAETKMKAVKVALSALTLDLIHCTDVQFKRAIVFCIAAAIWPTVRAIVIAIPLQQPAYTENITVKQRALANLNQVVKRYLSKVVLTPC